MSGRERIVGILMKRDGMTKNEANSYYDSVRSELLDALDGTSCLDPEEVLMDEIGLEPDYLFDFL